MPMWAPIRRRSPDWVTRLGRGDGPVEFARVDDMVGFSTLKLSMGKKKQHRGKCAEHVRLQKDGSERQSCL
jgi:hypothetical protein